MTSPTPLHNDSGRRICGAPLRKKPGRFCKSTLVMPNGRCRIHGGKSLGGIASPTYKDGRYSKYIPKRLMDAASAAALDPDLLSLREEIGLVYARIGDVLSRVDTGESGAMWAKVKSAFASFDNARGNEDEFKALAALRLSIEAGYSDSLAWGEIGELIEQRRKLVESEQKRLVAMNQMITAERAMLLFGAFAGILRKHVTDPQTLSAISSELGSLLNRGATIQADGGYSAEESTP